MATTAAVRRPSEEHAATVPPRARRRRAKTKGGAALRVVPAPATATRRAANTAQTTSPTPRRLRVRSTRDRSPATTAATAAPAATPAVSAQLAKLAKPGRPHLRLVPQPGAAVSAALVFAGVVVALMLAAVVLHTRLAERQLEIDRLESAVVEARGRFDVLRQQRAELRSPMRLSVTAQDQGMVTAPQTEFLTVDPRVLARTIAAAGSTDDPADGDDGITEPLEQTRRVKAAAP